MLKQDKTICVPFLTLGTNNQFFFLADPFLKILHTICLDIQPSLPDRVIDFAESTRIYLFGGGMRSMMSGSGGELEKRESVTEVIVE